MKRLSNLKNKIYYNFLLKSGDEKIDNCCNNCSFNVNEIDINFIENDKIYQIYDNNINLAKNMIKEYKYLCSNLDNIFKDDNFILCEICNKKFDIKENLDYHVEYSSIHKTNIIKKLEKET